MKRTFDDMTAPSGPILGLVWYHTQADSDDAAKAAHGDSWFSVKHTSYRFSYCADTEDFIQKMYQYIKDPKLEIYEQMRKDKPVRLVFDIEQCFDKEPTDTQAWLMRLVKVIQDALLAEGVLPRTTEKFTLTNNCRESDNNGPCFKVSFHLVFQEIVCQSVTVMHDFVLNKIKPLVEKQGSIYTWISWEKHRSGNGDNVPVIKNALDWLIYSNNRALRVPYANKGGKNPSILQPWDINSWAKIDVLRTEESFVSYMADSLVSNADFEDCEYKMLSARPAPLFPPQRPRAPEEKIPEASAAAPIVPEQKTSESLLRAGTPRERALVKASLGFFPQHVFDDTVKYIPLCHSVSTIYGKSEEGLKVLTEVSQRSRLWQPDSSPAWIAGIYHSGQGKRGMGSFLFDFRKYAPAIAKHMEEEYLVDAVQVIDEEDAAIQTEEYRTATKIDERVCTRWMRAWKDKHGAPESPQSMKEAAEARVIMEKQVTEYMNKWHIIVRRGSGDPICVEEWTTVSGQSRFAFRSQKSLAACYKKFTVRGVGNPADIWLQDENARDCDEIVFLPDNSHSPREFNMFRGFAIPREKAVEGDVKPFIWHIEHMWCKGDKKVSDYLLNWMAHLIQRPGIRMMTAPVLKGGQGAGKGIIINQFLAAIIGPASFLQCLTMDELTGKFTGEAIKTNLLCFLDEATFGGDKKQASVLKGLISEPTRKFELKHVNQVTIANYSNLIVASNYDTMVRVEKDDRRFLCLEVDSRFSGPQTEESREYFDKLGAVSVAAVAYYLYNRDISEFHKTMRSVPSTAYTRHQKTINFESPLAFVHELLDEGSHFDEEGVGEDVCKNQLFSEYGRFCDTDKFSKKVVKGDFFKELHRIVGRDNVVTSRPTTNGRRYHSVRIKSQAVARQNFCNEVKEQPETWTWSTSIDVPVPDVVPCVQFSEAELAKTFKNGGQVIVVQDAWPGMDDAD